MTVLQWPEEFCANVDTRFYLRSNSLSSLQQATGTRSVHGPLAQTWMAEMTVTRRERRDWLRIGAFFSRAGGISGLIRVGDPKRPHPLRNLQAARSTVPWDDEDAWLDGSYWTDTPLPPYALVDEAEERGATSFVVSGLPESLTNALYAGDLMEIRPDATAVSHGHLYEVYSDATTDGDGKVRVEINPPLRAAITYGDQVVLRKPTSVFRLVDDDQGILNHRGAGTADVGFALAEVLP